MNSNYYNDKLPALINTSVSKNLLRSQKIRNHNIYYFEIFYAVYLIPLGEYLFDVLKNNLRFNIVLPTITTAPSLVTLALSMDCWEIFLIAAGLWALDRINLNRMKFLMSRKSLCSTVNGMSPCIFCSVFLATSDSINVATSCGVIIVSTSIINIFSIKVYRYVHMCAYICTYMSICVRIRAYEYI